MTIYETFLFVSGLLGTIVAFAGVGPIVFLLQDRFPPRRPFGLDVGGNEPTSSTSVAYDLCWAAFVYGVPVTTIAVTMSLWTGAWYLALGAIVGLVHLFGFGARAVSTALAQDTRPRPR